MENMSMACFLYSALSCSMRRDVNPDPVPPPNEWKTMKPWSPLWASSTMRPIRSIDKSMSSLPMV